MLWLLGIQQVSCLSHVDEKRLPRDVKPQVCNMYKAQDLNSLILLPTDLNQLSIENSETLILQDRQI